MINLYSALKVNILWTDPIGFLNNHGRWDDYNVTVSCPQIFHLKLPVRLQDSHCFLIKYYENVLQFYVLKYVSTLI
jgi:hypothetical protein